MKIQILKVIAAEAAFVSMLVLIAIWAVRSVA